MNKYTQNQRKSRNKSSSSNKAIISEDAHPWPDGTRAKRSTKTQSPSAAGLRLLLHAQFRTSRRALNVLFVRAGLFEHGAKPKPCGGRGRWDLLRLARSSAAGQGVLVLLDGLDALHRLESLEHGVAVQVINLVLQAHAEQVA